MTGPEFNRDGIVPPFGSLLPADLAWLSRGAKEEILFPEIPIIDPHHHLWIRPGDHYLVKEFADDVNTGHNIVATVYANCHSMYRAGGPEHLKVVGETEFAVGQAAQSASGMYGKARIAATVFGYADVTRGSAIREVLAAHVKAGNGRFKGIRFLCNFDPSDEIRNGTVAVRHDMLRDSTVQAAIKVVSEMGLVLDLYAFFHQLDQVAELARAQPDLTIVINHCGGPLSYGPYREGDPEMSAQWKRGIVEMARCHNIVCKLGGLVNRTTAYDYRTAEVPPTSQALAGMWRHWVEPCIEAFGPDRCMFESNFPPDKAGIAYPVLWNAFKHLTSSASDSERNALFSGTAARVYGLTT